MLVVGLIALLGIVGSTIWLNERAQHYFDQVVEARDLRTASSNLRILLHEVESSQRGFLLTGEESYLDPYDEASARLMPAFERLRGLTAIAPQFTAPLDRLLPDIQAKVEELAETISLARQGRTDEAIAIVATDRGKQIMDEARTLLRDIVEVAEQLLTDSVEEQRSSANYLRVGVFGGGVLIILVVGSSVWIALSYTRDLIQARSEVEVLNTGLETRVRERTQDLIRANEEVQRFAYIVTHDLRAPLVNIMGFTSELDETMKSIQAYVLADGDALSQQEIQEARTAAAEDLPEAISFIRSSTRKMDGLINAILKISRDGKRPLKPENIDLKGLLEANLATIQHQVVEADGNTSLAVNVDYLVSDRMSLEQIVGNLLDNAVKYRDTGRPLSIRISAERAPGRQVRIDVSDNGRGIAPEDHQRVFDLFRRSGRQDQPGEGIGLAHVRTLARSLGGDITLSSQFGEGTTFSILLPMDVRTVTRNDA